MADPTAEGPLSGYVCTSFGGQAATRLGAAEAQGCAANPGDTSKKLSQSDIIFFSGHHYARYGAPLEFDAIDLRHKRFTPSRARLLMISSCAGCVRTRCTASAGSSPTPPSSAGAAARR